MEQNADPIWLIGPCFPSSKKELVTITIAIFSIDT